jgi:hypothetical protein
MPSAQYVKAIRIQEFRRKREKLFTQYPISSSLFSVLNLYRFPTKKQWLNLIFIPNGIQMLKSTVMVK